MSAAIPEVNGATRQRSRPTDEEKAVGDTASENETKKHLSALDNDVVDFWARFRGKGRKRVGWMQSFKNIALSSPLNALLIFIPFAWASHWNMHWSRLVAFILCFISIIPLEHLFEWGGEQMAFYLGRDLGDLLVITLNNAVEATLAILLLVRCELRLLQSTIAGVVVLHLLLIPGTAFITGGARIWEQHLHPHLTQLNQSLLTVGVMSLLLPAAFFAALDRGTAATIEGGIMPLVSDTTRGQFLKMSRGLAIMLLVIYICSRIFLHNPPGEDNALGLAKRHDAPEELKRNEQHLADADPEADVWPCLIMLVATVAIMAATAEWLVDSIEFVREQGSIQEEWFGLILLPLVSFAADGAVAAIFFGRYMLRVFFGTPPPPATLAKGRAIDLSIQFTLFWMPFVVLLGWWADKPMTLLFDFFEVAVLIGACFLVNYVTADAKTNWAEGVVLLVFYFMIALVAWFYTGQPEIHEMLVCESIAAALAGAAGEGNTTESGATVGH